MMIGGFVEFVDLITTFAVIKASTDLIVWLLSADFAQLSFLDLKNNYDTQIFASKIGNLGQHTSLFPLKFFFFGHDFKCFIIS